MINSLSPGWKPALTICTVFISLQSLLSSKPYYDFYEEGVRLGINEVNESQEYNVKIQYETIRVAILDMIVGSNDTMDMPVQLKQKMMAYFTKNIVHYEQMIRFYTEVYQSNSEYDYEGLFNRFIRLKERLGNKKGKYSLTPLFHVPVAPRVETQPFLCEFD